MPRNPEIITTVDAVLVTLDEQKLKVVVIERDHEPFIHENALPGGFFHPETDTNAEDAMRRVIGNKLGLHNLFLEQLYTVSGPARDPRGWSLSVVFLGLFPTNTLTLPQNAKLVNLIDTGTLAFDHQEIAKIALARLRGKGAYSTLPATLLPSPFTLTDLQKVYETTLNQKLETSAFRRKIQALDLLEPAVPTLETTNKRGRPSQYWQLKDTVRTFDKRSIATN